MPTDEAEAGPPSLSHCCFLQTHQTARRQPLWVRVGLSAAGNRGEGPELLPHARSTGPLDWPQGQRWGHTTGVRSQAQTMSASDSQPRGRYPRRDIWEGMGVFWIAAITWGHGENVVGRDANCAETSKRVFVAEDCPACFIMELRFKHPPERMALS